jgi:hypothetical protein
MKLNLIKQMRWESGITLGAVVEVRWTNSNRFYTGKGTIAKLNEATVRVALTEHVPSQIGYGGYPVGQEIRVPRSTPKGMKLWSWNNCILPIDKSVIDDYIGRTVRRPDMGEGKVVGRVGTMYPGNDPASHDWLVVQCNDGLERTTPEDRVILCPDTPTH